MGIARDTHHIWYVFLLCTRHVVHWLVETGSLQQWDYNSKNFLIRGLAEARARNPGTDLARYIEAYIMIQASLLANAPPIMIAEITPYIRSSTPSYPMPKGPHRTTTSMGHHGSAANDRRT